MSKSNVENPKHYNVGDIEVIDAIEDWKMGFCDGNVIKYVARHKLKGRPIEDLKKVMSSSFLMMVVYLKLSMFSLTNHSIS